MWPSLSRAASRVPRRYFAKSPAPDSKVLEQLIKDNPKLAQASQKLAEALKLANASAPSVAEIDTLANQYVNVKAATSFSHTAAAELLSAGNVASLARPPVRVAITGAAGAIGYSLIFRIASGMMLGPHQPVVLHLLEIDPALKALEGVVMELRDCAFPLLSGVVTTSDAEKAFEGVDFALLVGSKPRTKGMERGDLLNENGKIFVGQGKALNKFANKDVKVVVVGNPANTNCLIAASNAPNIPRDNFSALTRLDHDRALAQVSERLKVPPSAISRLAIWGNHSATQYPDITHAVAAGKQVKSAVDDKWVREAFIPTVQKRGAAIIEARGASSAASAANAALCHMRDWVGGTNGEWTSMAVPSCKAYGIGEGVFYSYPVICADGKFSKVLDLKPDAFSVEMMEATKKELFAERDLVKSMLPN